MEKVEFLVLKNLLNNEEYLRKTIPFIKEEYFEENKYKVVFEEISSFANEYNETPTKEIISIEVEKRKDLNQDSLKDILHLIECLDDYPCLLYTSPSPRDATLSRMPSSA